MPSASTATQELPSSSPTLVARCFSYMNGKITPGLPLSEHGGVLLGEEGPKRTAADLRPSRDIPPILVEGRVIDASVEHKISFARPGEESSTLWALRAPPPQPENDGILIRINTQGEYTKGEQGKWSVVAGNPELIVPGEGRHGRAGNLPGWRDDLVTMRQGDAILVVTEGGEKTENYVIYLEGMEPRTMLHREWRAATMVKEITNPAACQLAFGAMPVGSLRGDPATFEPGIVCKEGSAGPAVVVGAAGRGRRQVELPLVGFEESPVEVKSAAVVKVGESYCLVPSEGRNAEQGAFAVAICSMVSREYRTLTPLRGNPTCIARGQLADGDAGYAASGVDHIWVMRPGDYLVLKREDVPLSVFANINGVVGKIDWFSCSEFEQALSPASWVELRFAASNARQALPGGFSSISGNPQRVRELLGNGNCVRFEEAYRPGNGLRDDRTVMQEYNSARSVIVDGVEYGPMNISSLRRWLETQQSAQTGSQNIAQTVEDPVRKGAYDRYLKVREAIEELLNAPFASCLPYDLKERAEFACQKRLPTKDDLAGLKPDQINNHSESAEELQRALQDTAEEAKKLYARQNNREILVNYPFMRNRSNAASQDFWVIQPDGSLKMSDISPAGHRNPLKIWSLIGPDDLALSWKCATGRNPHDSEQSIEKMPVNGITKAQLEAVKRIEQDDINVPYGLFGLHPEAVKRDQSWVKRMQQGCPKCPVTGEPLPWSINTYRQAAGPWGWTCYSGPQAGKIIKDWKKPYDTETNNRPALLVERRSVGGGEIEVLFYEKGGDCHVALRVTQNEKNPDEEDSGFEGSEELPTVKDEPTSEPVDIATVDLSRLFRGSAKPPKK